MSRENEPKHYVITGGTGFLGRKLIELLHQQGHELTLLLRKAKIWHDYDWTKNYHERLSVVEIDLLDQTSLLEPAAWSKSVDGIFHLAALVAHSREQADLIESFNVQSTLAMVNLAHMCQCKVVVLSSAGVVGCFRSPTDSADEHAPYLVETIKNWPYFYSKYLMEVKAFELAQSKQVPLVMIRPPVLLGPCDHRLRSTQHVFRALASRSPLLLKGGMSFCDVRDVAAAIGRAMAIPNAKAVYHLSGHGMELKDFYFLVAKCAGKKVSPIILPYKLVVLLSKLLSFSQKFLPLDQLVKLPDSVLIEMGRHYWSVHSCYAEKDLGYTLREADSIIADTIDWLKSNGLLSAD